MNEVEENYYSGLYSHLSAYVGCSQSPETEKGLFQVAAQYRARFLLDHPEYVDAGQIKVDLGVPGHATVKADVETRKQREDRIAASIKAEALLKQINEKEAIRRQNMRHKVEKLEKKHVLPSAISDVWHTLEDFQKLAILKDLDYAARHQDT